MKDKELRIAELECEIFMMEDIYGEGSPEVYHLYLELEELKNN